MLRPPGTDRTSKGRSTWWRRFSSGWSGYRASPRSATSRAPCKVPKLKMAWISSRNDSGVGFCDSRSSRRAAPVFMGAIIPLLGMVFPLLAISGSDPAEVEEIHLGVDGETDPLEEALVANEVGPAPVRAQEDGCFHIERLPFVGWNSEHIPVDRSLDQAHPCAQDGLSQDWQRIPDQTFCYNRLENTPGGGGVHHR